MKVNKLKVMSMVGALGLTAGVLAGCGAEEEQEEYVKVVDKDGNTVYVEEDELDEDGHSAFFVPFYMWNGSNHTSLKPASGFKGTVSKTKPSVNLSKSSKSGIGKSSGKSSGFGG